MHPDLRDSASTGADLTVMLDGRPVPLPPQRRSLAAIRSYLETLALEKQRILFSLRIDGARVNLSAMLPTQRKFERVEAETIDLAEVPLKLINTAMVQTSEAETQVLSAVALVLINEAGWAREHWWSLARLLHQPLLTLSLMPETAYGSESAGASLVQLRKWQLQQLGAIFKRYRRSLVLGQSRCPFDCARISGPALAARTGNLTRTLARDLGNQTLSQRDRYCVTRLRRGTV